MARFKLNKSKKKVEEGDDSMTYEPEYEVKRGHGILGREESTSKAKHGQALGSNEPSIGKSSAVRAARKPVGATTPWRRYKISNSPFPRYRHAAAAVASDKGEIFLMGGLKEGSVFGDTWKVMPQEGASGELISYEAKMIDVVNLNIPPARVGHSSVLCGNAFIVYGGDTVDTDFNGFPDNNFYLFNINNNKYTIPTHIQNKPNGRYGHTIGAISLNSNSSRLYLFGGQLENDVFADMYYFELNTFKSPHAKWELVQPLNNFKPPPLTNHSMSVYKHKMYIFGGVYNNEKVSNDLWTFDALSNKWVQLPTTGTIPLPVNEHSSCIANDKLYIYGGNDFSGIIYNTLYVLDIHTLTWHKLAEFGETYGPGPRCGHTMTYLPKFNRIVIMGGDKNDYVNDDPTDFQTYEEYPGTINGTMVYELDLDLVDDFLANPQEEDALAGVPTSTKKNEFPPSTSANRDSYQRHARSFSAGPEDFRTPGASPERAIETSDLNPPQDKFVDVDMTLATVSDHNSVTQPYPSDAKEVSFTDHILEAGSNGPNSNFLADTAATNGSRDQVKANSTPASKGTSMSEPRSAKTADSSVPSTAGNGELKVKSLVNELTGELNSLKDSAKRQMQNATSKIESLEKENSSLKQQNEAQIVQLRKQLSEKDDIIMVLKSKVDPSELEITDEQSKEISQGDVPLLSKFKLERMELNNKLLYLEKENKQLNEKFVHFEPIMNNQIGELAVFQKVISSQEEKIEKLSKQVRDQQELHQQINSWKTKYENIALEFENYKTIHSEGELSEEEEEAGTSKGLDSRDADKSTISNASAGIRSKKELSSHLESLVSLWSVRKDSAPAKGIEDLNSKSKNDDLVAKLQKQVEDLLSIGKQNDEEYNSKIKHLEGDLASKLASLKTFEQNYKDALQSVNNTSKALKVNKEDLAGQRSLIERLIQENNELKIFKKASQRSSSHPSTPRLQEGGSADNDDEDELIANAHYNMKIKDLEADLYIMKNERDRLRDTVDSLQKEVILAKNDS